ncbi:T9SS type A sorting domain-containing protein [Draconibacterium sp. IB214405]|uniref:T9SS type A sorting domain-containing protein n=1 Tax=Draconibacterium sp. IB214405 TaxID=3097352 RepID=UPI002A118081|nr:T9SS type A sorting domain-containing protein [Draconibacterium sp. IB214405]MDX8338808.1 T9SS type A sorting domain-containing protein [Draconibacterium sp. IB214405]
MKTILHALKCIAILLIAILLYGCPVFKSIKYPKTVYLGDTVTVHVNVDLMGFTDNDGAELEIFLPEGWRLTDKVIDFNGTSNSSYTLSHNLESDDDYWSTTISEPIISNNVLFDFDLMNTKSSPSVDTFRIGFRAINQIYHSDQKFTIQSTNNENIPTQFRYNNDTLEWKIAKNSTDIKGYNVTDNLNSWFTTDNKFKVVAGTELHRYSVSAVTNTDQEYALIDTISIFHGDMLFVSGMGNDNNSGNETSPLRSLNLALNVIDEDYVLSQDKSIRLLDGTYVLESEAQLRDRLSLIGNGPQNSIIYCTGDDIAFNSPHLNSGFSLENLSIRALQNEVILNFGLNYFGEPSIKLSHVQLYNDGHTSDGIRANASKLIIDHSVVAGMDGNGIVGLNIQMYHSVVVQNHVGLFVAISDLAWGTSRIVNSIFFENQTSISSDYLSSDLQGTVFINNTLIDEQWIYNGKANFYADPLFIDDENYPYLLDPYSPAVDAAIDSSKYYDPSLEDDRQALFPARGTIRGDLGIYGGEGNDYFNAIVTHRIYHELDVYPNPVKDVLTVHWPNNKIPDKLWLSNVNGERLNFNYRNNEIDVSNYAPGLYLFYAEIDGKYYRSKIIKN